MSKVYGNIGEKVSGWYKAAANFFIKYDERRNIDPIKYRNMAL